jgi:hypothetical protein
MERCAPKRSKLTTRLIAVVACASAVTLFLPVSAAAQASTVQDVVGFLVTNRGVETGDFDKDREAADATAATLTRALLSAIAQVPISTSSSGFTYRLNPALGTVERASETFGPFFVERALTSGGGQAAFGVNFQYASFTSLDGHDLSAGTLVTTANQFRDEPAPFDVETLTLQIATRTVTAFGTYGLTDRLDIAGAVPFVSLDIYGTRINTYRGESLLQARATAETLGLGDVAVRSKYRLTPDGPTHAAAAVEVRLPTGRDEDLLGAGELAMRVLGIWSTEIAGTSVHGNVGLGTGGLGRELSVGAAVAHAPSPRLTLVGELLLRRAAGTQEIAPVSAPHPRIAGVDTIRLMPIGDSRFASIAVAGFKWNVAGTWLLQGNVLMPITARGLTARFTPMLALDYSFTQ